MEAGKASVNLLLLVTGSIAAVKVGLLVDQLFGEPFNIRIAATKSAFHFLTRVQHSGREFPLHRVLTDDDEWREWQGMNDAVMHIELRRWADLVVIAPLDANSLAKLSNGLCDNLVTCVMRAWEVRKKPVIVCPAMNTAMWTHPVTATQLNTLRDWYSAAPTITTTNTTTNTNTNTSNTTTANHTNTNTNSTSNVNNTSSGIHVDNVDLHTTTNTSNSELDEPLHLPATFDESLFQLVGPVRKRLACGDIGIGGMASVEDIATVIRHTADLIRAGRANTAEESTVNEQNKPQEPQGEKN
ncbi:putative conserved flavoprotein [Trypanosoma theileri]|uniref:Putative conserved flavoprotein n=1 Tax=Trypanosoma theileri TaxID=67003 RepID=A0A1X0P262_9TRYP|nr:putative conserved flavoprotein [Trypanosoma theileri]ORC90918.1 putative conserved flavoprotein [Trypanosoma theileri]